MEHAVVDVFALVIAQHGRGDEHADETVTADEFDQAVDDAEIDFPVEQSDDVVSEAIERTDGDAIEGISQLEAFLTGEGLSVTRLDTGERAGETVLELAYVAADPEAEGTVRELGVVAGGYARLVRSGSDGDTLEARIHDRDGTESGRSISRRRGREPSTRAR